MSLSQIRLIGLLISRNIREEKLFSILSIIGIALGIGLYISVQAATDKAITAFSNDISTLDTVSNIQLTSNVGTYLDESIYATLLKQGETVFPVLMTKALDQTASTNISLYGTDLLKAWHAAKPNIKMDRLNLSSFFSENNAVLVPQYFAHQKGIAVGDSFGLSAFDQSYTFRIVGIYDEKELNFDGILIDIAHFQELFSLEGRLSWVEVRTSNPETLAKVIPDSVTIQTKVELVRQKEQVIRSFQHNLQFISFIAILVGFFLLFNTVFISIVKKRTQIGILRSLGMRTREILTLFVGFGLILGSVGTAIGIILGQLLTGFTMAMTEKTVSSIYAMITLQDVGVDWVYIMQAVGIGLVVSFVSSFIPAMEASKIKPNETAREGSFENRYRPYYKPIFFIGLVVIGCGIGLVMVDYSVSKSGTPLYSYGGILFIIAGFTLSSPYYLQWVNNGIKRVLSQFKSTSLIIATGNIKGSISRFSIALVSVAISTALIVSMFVLIHSFRSSFKSWIDETLIADTYVKPASCVSNFCFEPLSKDIIEKVRTLDVVESINPFTVMKGTADDERFLFGFGDKRIVAQYHQKGTVFVDPNLISITEQVSQKLGKVVGDNITIKTPIGNKIFEVGEVFTTYSTTEGLIILDRSWLEKLWKETYSNQLSIFLKDDVDGEEFTHMLQTDILKDYSLELLSNQAIRTKVLNIFDKSFAMTYAIQLIAFIVSLIGIINTLTAIVIENQREISVLRYMGTGFGRIKRIYIGSAAITGVSGILMGSVIGGILSVILVKVINAISFGWTIHFHVPMGSLVLVLSILLILVVLSGMIPITLIRKMDPKKYISFE